MPIFPCENKSMIGSRFGMKATQALLWESVTRPIANALEFAFGCHHPRLSRVFTINRQSYKVCCDCGATFQYSLRTMSVVPHHTRLLALRRLRARRMRSQLLRPTHVT